MFKKSNKILSLFLAGSLATISALSTIETVKADEIDWNVVYRNAYDSVINVKKYKNQVSINEARENIAKLTPGWMKAYREEFSKQVDTSQQYLFEQFYSLICYRGELFKSISQENINKARQYINEFKTYGGNTPYISTWSSVLDVFQQTNMKKANESIELAKQYRDYANIENAKQKVSNLLKVEANECVKVYAQELENQLIEFLNTLSSNEVGAIYIIKCLEQFTVDHKFYDNKEMIQKTIKIGDDLVYQLENKRMKKELSDKLEIGKKQFNHVFKK
ncbi:hypothetical protein C3495_02755 [Clostridiaceae bacterium 14S0207]|nr:hypothetical protein C3495_02755 [Clostridiaceae bacterium 14S0207]